MTLSRNGRAVILTCDVKGQLRCILKDGINKSTTHVLTDIVIFNIFPENDTRELVEIWDLKLQPAGLKAKASMYPCSLHVLFIVLFK